MQNGILHGQTFVPLTGVVSQSECCFGGRGTVLTEENRYVHSKNCSKSRWRPRGRGEVTKPKFCTETRPEEGCQRSVGVFRPLVGKQRNAQRATPSGWSSWQSPMLEKASAFEMRKRKLGKMRPNKMRGEASRERSEPASEARNHAASEAKRQSRAKHIVREHTRQQVRAARFKQSGAARLLWFEPTAKGGDFACEAAMRPEQPLDDAQRAAELASEARRVRRAERKRLARGRRQARAADERTARVKTRKTRVRTK